MPLIGVIHGPNLNLLGSREVDIYGTTTLAELDELLRAEARRLALDVEIVQSNIEGVLVERVHDFGRRAHAILLNAAAYTHTSIAIRDAVAAIHVPTIEVHLSIPDARESFRRQNFLAGVVRGRIEGFGPKSYLLALRAASELVASSRGIND